MIPCGGTDQHDGSAAAAGNQRRNGGVHGVPGADQVDLDDVAERPSPIVAVGHPDDARVGDDDVEAAELPNAVGDHRVDRFGVTNISLARQDPAALVLNQFHCGGKVVGGRAGVVGGVELRADVDGDDVGALAGQLDRVRPPHPTGGTGDEGDMPVQSAHRHAFGKLTFLVTASHSSIDADSARACRASP